MEKRLFGVILITLASILPLQAREVVFIGLTGESAPGIQVNFSRMLQERLAKADSIQLVNNPETERLRLQLGGLTYPALTASLASSLRRCAGDSALVVWGLVKDLSFKIQRKRVIKKQLSAHLSLELAVYDPLTQSYAYSGEVVASLLEDRGYTTEFGNLDRTDQLSATDRMRFLDSLESQAAARAVAVLVKAVRNYHVAVADSAKAGKPDPVAPAASPAPDSSKTVRTGTPGKPK